MGNTDAPKAPAGWYPLDGESDGERYWDGTSWTGETRNLDPAPSPVKGSAKSRKLTLQIALGAAIALVLVAYGIFHFASIKNVTTVDFVKSSDVRGKSEAEALDFLKKSGFADVEVLRVPCDSDAENGLVYTLYQTGKIGPKKIPTSLPATIEVNDCSLGYFDSEGNVVDAAGNPFEGSVASAPSESWLPAGFTKFNDDMGYRWVDNANDPCGASACQYLTIEAVSHYGCPRGVYVAINFTANGEVIDWNNESIPALSAGQTAMMQFISYKNGSDSGQVVKMNCK